jgi:hypothetical protein
MKPLRTKPGLVTCLVISALFTGCAHKKPQVATPTAEQAPPAVQPAPEPTPAEAPAQNESAQTPAQGTPPPAPDQTQPADDKTENSKTHNGKQHTSGKKNAQTAGKSTSETARIAPPKVVVKSDDAAAGPPPGLISPGPARPDAAHDQATTEQLLQSAEANLNGIKRQLSEKEQADVTQIRDYVSQSRQATKENDAVRAHTLALKAQLLSDELARRR